MLQCLTRLFHQSRPCQPKLLHSLATSAPTLTHPCSHSYLKTLCMKGELKEALLEMCNQGVEVKFDGYDSLLTMCINQRAIRDGQRVHAHIIKTRYLPPVYLETRLIVLYIKCSLLGDARKVFDQMPQRNVVSWTAMISAYSQRGCHSESLDLFLQMLRSGTPPNEFTFATVLTSCNGDIGFGRQVQSMLIKSSFETHVFVGSSLLDMYAKAGRIHEARGVFETLPRRDVVSCTAIISGYAQLGLDEEALELFRRLLEDGMESNYVTYASVLTALAGLAAFDHGRQIHNRIIRSQLPSYVVLDNSLIDMYSKCGNLAYSRRVFDRMLERTAVTWNAMLVGYGKHGFGREVIELFGLMKKDKEVKPDTVTFMAVLSGCSHGGLVDEGLAVFDEMNNEKDGIKPETEHYGCVVDLLGRAGRVDEAFDFIKSMPFEATAAIWGSLLGACRAHANVFVGEAVAHRLFAIEPENAGNYVILSNLYASAGRWEDVRYVRELMKDKAVTKEPGRSWIKLGRVVHTLHAGDWSHPRKEEVVNKVRELAVKIRAAGYVHDLSCVFHDVDNEQKEKLLLSHSEKLAIALGLIGTPSGYPIMVFKNLRICVDCHNFAKFVSKICGREISIRDNKRYHHIAGGICSCADYW
ncbi:hypothetical protein Scep_015804 [Stephania cephalantha]|uniref:DYW domain-containing protein n=1 Tax=Stephania cephalantha TaxID=152367 RepID=A0AAP0J3W1_9MAGN